MQLYAAGSNGSGQLATGHQDDTSSFTPTQFHPSVQHLLPGSTVVDLVSASTHALLLLRTSPEIGAPARHILLGAGTNTLGQLGPKCLLWEGIKPETRWKPVDFLSGLGKGGHEEWEAVKVAVTWTTSFVLYRRTGTGGGGAAVRVDGDGPEEILVSCGSNDFGELGRGDTSGEEESASSDLPTLVDLGLRKGERVEMLRGGQRHVLTVISGPDGQRVVGWGANRKGELDPTTMDSSALKPNGVDPAMVGKTEDGRSKGKGKSSGTGKSTLRQSILPPMTLHLPIPPGTSIVDIRLGASHSLALLSTGKVLAWGSDAKGQIAGLSSISDAVGIAATWGGSYILRQSSGGSGGAELLSQGASSHSQLLRPAAHGPSRGPVQLPEGRSVKSIVAGSEHLLVSLQGRSRAEPTDELWVGGWNEHGNLGLGDAEDRAELVKVDLASLGGAPAEGGGRRIKGIWGGCGSSWMYLE